LAKSEQVTFPSHREEKHSSVICIHREETNLPHPNIHSFPRGVTAISQVLWGSIGYAVGACQGATLAADELHREPHSAAGDRGRPDHVTSPVDATGRRRTILFEGDGSLQLTATEVSTMVRRGLRPILFIIVNNGYTIERMIHGMTAHYNDIQPWRNAKLFETFGALEGKYRTYSVKTRGGLEKLFADEQFASADVIQVSERKKNS
jgi:pyruvate decarboxylase